MSNFDSPLLLLLPLSSAFRCKMRITTAGEDGCHEKETAAAASSSADFCCGGGGGGAGRTREVRQNKFEGGNNMTHGGRRSVAYVWRLR